MYSKKSKETDAVYFHTELYFPTYSLDAHSVKKGESVFNPRLYPRLRAGPSSCCFHDDQAKYIPDPGVRYLRRSSLEYHASQQLKNVLIRELSRRARARPSCVSSFPLTLKQQTLCWPARSLFSFARADCESKLVQSIWNYNLLGDVI